MPSIIRQTLVLFALLVLGALIAPFVAFAATTDAPAQPVTLALPWVQLAALLVGFIVPLFTYVLNHYAPWVGEPVKAAVLVVVTAVAGALTDAIVGGNFGFDQQTLQVVITAVIGALGAHKWLYVPSTINTLLGGGRNR